MWYTVVIMSKDKREKPKCVLFDADGVVITRHEQMSEKYIRTFDVSETEVLAFFTGPFQDCIIGKADLKEEIVPFLDKWGWHGSIDEFLSWWFNSEHSLDTQVVDVIKGLKKQGILVYLATNQEKYRGEYMRNEMGFGELFDGIFTSAEVGLKKPDGVFYKHVLAEIKRDCDAEPSEVLFFDDDQQNVDGAKNAGIDAYLYKEFDDLKKQLTW